jgi:hypothetical protein
MKERLSALWVRNFIGFLVLLVAGGVTVAMILAYQWGGYRASVVPETVVPVGQSGTAGGSTWQIKTIRYLDRSPLSFGPQLPPGTILRVITVDRKGPVTNEICRGVITDGVRSWNAEGIGGFQPRPPDGGSTMCNQPGLLQYTFLMPKDVVPTALDITKYQGQMLVRLQL